MRVAAVVVAGGSSTRMRGTDKIMLKLGSTTVLEKTLSVFCTHPDIAQVVPVVKKELFSYVKELRSKYPTLSAPVEGGDTRCLSVKNGIAACNPTTDLVAIHDCARPFVSKELITKLIDTAAEHGAAAPVLPVTDTIKTTDENGFLTGTLNRSELRAIQTPQVFNFNEYREAIQSQTEAFDDCQVYEKTGHRVKTIIGEAGNYKITVPEDAQRAKQNDCGGKMRIGHGYDVHRLTENRKLIIGGVEIPYEKGLLGHSDADVLIHALCDAILGAVGLGDIGKHFPDTDPQYEGADSRVLLRRCVQLARDKGFCVSNADITVICQKPKLASYIPQMVNNLAQDMCIEPDCVNVKATTEEKLGFTGSGEGISAHAVTLLERID